MPWPSFEEDEPIIGWPLLDLIDWVVKSNSVLNGETVVEGMPVVAMPPMQRSAVWRAKQVVDLWDSLMRGLPIGTFYLLSAKGRRTVVGIHANRTQPFIGDGFDLLDGQQRLRTLLVGAVGFKEEKRCLWVDLGASGAGQHPCLHLTSKAQPFGYDAKTGQKLSLNDRRNARRAIEPEGHDITHVIGGKPRRAYDLELFEGQVKQDDEPLQPQPPLPYKATKAHTFKLIELINVWRSASSHDAKERIAALRAMVGETPREEALSALHVSLCRVEKARVALMRIDSDSFHDRNEDLLTLFERIGAGGTALSVEERLYSIYKYHAPYIRNAVNKIYDGVGRVLPPTKIASAALRIVNAQHFDRNDMPDVSTFAEAMADSHGPFREKLEKLIPTEEGHSVEIGSLSHSFTTIHHLLSHPGYEDADTFWLPDVMLVSLPAELWQVLVFWAIQNPNPKNPVFCQQEMVRFALFWHLCAWNNEKAARWSFAYIKDIKDENADFPGAALYQRLIGTTGEDWCAYRLIASEDFAARICKPPTSVWRTDAERFVKDNVRNDIGSLWWSNGRKILPWLQKDYIRRKFPSYAPLTDHEDDLPYDVDHICPWNDCGDWVSIRNRFARFGNVEKSIQQRMRDQKDAIANGIGNLRLIEASANKRDQDDDIAEKMPFVLCDGTPSEWDECAMSDWAFPPEGRELWRHVSRPGPVADRKWDNDRLAEFQRAVEQRAAWLYCRFHDGLAYAAWTLTPTSATTR